MTPPIRMVSVPVEDLIDIVEGIGGIQHGTWRDEKGQRLKDTPAWTAFYVAARNTAAPVREEGGEVIRKALQAELDWHDRVADFACDEARECSARGEKADEATAMRRMSAHNERASLIRTALAAREEAPAPEGGAVKRACVVFQEAIDDFEADVADVMAEGSERADLWDREITVNIDALKTVMSAALTTREEAPAEAGVSQDDLAALERVIGIEYYAGSDRLGEALERILQHLRAQPPAREEAQPVADAVEPIELAIAALKGHISAIQVAKRGGGSSSLITDCINSLPEIVRWVEGGLFNVEAAFEQYEATPPAPEAEKLRAAVEALKPFARAADRLDGLWSEDDWRWNDSVRSGVTVRDVRRARQALSVLQAEQGAK